MTNKGGTSQLSSSGLRNTLQNYQALANNKEWAATPKSQTEESDIASMEFQKKTKADRTVPISAASVITGIEVHTLRYWEREFAEFLNPVRTAGGQRRYGPEDIQTLFLIKRLLRDEMFSIAGARKHLIKQFSTIAA
jgi:MerR HTH family regulatory protein